MDPVNAFAERLVAAREAYEEETRQELLKKMDSLFSRWRHYQGSWDVSGTWADRTEGFEQALSLLAECYEELRGD